MMKGWELYSWANGNDWNFALLPGTNRLKTMREITESNSTLVGVANIKNELAGLARGEEVVWVGRGADNFVLPPQSTVDEIKQFCAERGIQLALNMGS